MADNTYIPIKDRVTCTVEEARAISGLGRSTIWEAMAKGRLRHVNYGRRRLIVVSSLLEMLNPEHSHAA